MKFDKSIINNETLFISHVDLDGVLPFILNRYYKFDYGKEVPTNYGDLVEDEYIPQYKNVVFVDFSPSESTRKLIEKYNINCLILDHHIAVNEELNEWCKNYENVEYVFDNEKCGTKLYYEWLMNQGFTNKDIIKYIVELTNTYDLYKQSDKLWTIAERFNRLLYSTAKWYIKDDKLKMYEFFINTILWKMENVDNFFFSKLELSKIEGDINKENSIFNDLVNNAKENISTRIDEKGSYFCVITCNTKVSAICNRLLSKYKKLSYVICINKYDEDSPKISVRTRDDFNGLNLEFCKGHEQACGVSDELTNVKELSEKLLNKEIYALRRLD